MLDDLHIFDLFLYHFDCSKQHNLRQFSLTPVQPWAQAPPVFESARAIRNVFVRAKAKRLTVWTCDTFVKREKFVCPQSDDEHRRHYRSDYHQKTMERPTECSTGPLNPTECKHATRHLNGTDNHQLIFF